MENNYITKWKITGFLAGLSGDTELKVAEAFELAENILTENKEYNETPAIVIVFPLIRRILSYGGECQSKLPETFEFNNTNMRHLIDLINDAWTVIELLSSRMVKTIDIEAELSVFICELFITEQSYILNQHT